MKLQIQKLPPTNVRLIPVASELLGEMQASQIKEIEHEDKIYKVYDFFAYKKESSFGRSLLYMATGKKISADIIFSHYKDSEMIYFFIAEPQR